MNTRELQQKAVNGSEKSLNVNELWDFDAPKDQWKRMSLAMIAEVLGVEKLTTGINNDLTAAGGERVPNPFMINKVKVRGWNMPPLRGAVSLSSICLPADTAAVEELSPVLANGELQQETVQDAPESPESDAGQKAELVELETGDAKRGCAEGVTVSLGEIVSKIAKAGTGTADDLAYFRSDFPKSRKLRRSRRLR